jgi:3-oxoacyl-[acyl-carrier protein] reductase
MTILITGGSTGIGAETARHLAPGNRVLIHYNASEKEAREVAREVAEAGGTADLFQADLMSEGGCVTLVDGVSAAVDSLDVLVNNAGGLIRRQPVGQLQWSLMEEIFSLNAFSAMMMTSLCVPLLEKGTNPCIVNISSIAMRTGAPSATIYGASKGAVDSFTRGAAKELAPGIRVNAVAPGVIETPFHEKVSTPEKMKSFAESTPLGKNGLAGDIARAIKFVVESPFMTGETVDVNGGLFMH